MKRFKRSILYLITLAGDLFACPAVLLVRLFWGRNLHIQEGCLATEVKLGSWPLRTFMKPYSGITLGHGFLYREGRAGSIELTGEIDEMFGIEYEKWNFVDTTLEEHEHRHVEQFEGMMLLGLVYAALAALLARLGLWYVLPVLWPLAPPAFVLCNSVVAWLRGEEFYRGASHEEGARGAPFNNEDVEIDIARGTHEENTPDHVEVYKGTSMGPTAGPDLIPGHKYRMNNGETFTVPNSVMSIDFGETTIDEVKEAVDTLTDYKNAEVETRDNLNAVIDTFIKPDEVDEFDETFGETSPEFDEYAATVLDKMAVEAGIPIEILKNHPGPAFRHFFGGEPNPDFEGDVEIDIVKEDPGPQVDKMIFEPTTWDDPADPPKKYILSFNCFYCHYLNAREFDRDYIKPDDRFKCSTCGAVSGATDDLRLVEKGSKP